MILCLLIAIFLPMKLIIMIINDCLERLSGIKKTEIPSVFIFHASN